MDEAPQWFQVYQAQATVRYNDLVIRLNDLEIGLAVTYNRTSLRCDDALKPLLGVNGIIPPNFPATRNDLFRLSQEKCMSLLHAYNLNAEGTILVKRNRLASHVGLIL
jgi:hypothetical protein